MNAVEQRLEGIFVRIQALPRPSPFSKTNRWDDPRAGVLAMFIGSLKAIAFSPPLPGGVPEMTEQVVDALDRAVKFEEQSGPSAKPEDTK